MLGPRDWPLLPVFVAVANAGSFTGAARQLRLAKSVVSLHVRTLEQRCGVRLMERNTRRLHLTQIGEQILEAAKEALTSVRAVEQIVEGHRDAPSGKLRVTLPLDPSLSVMIAPIAAALTKRHPALKIDLVFDDAVRDLVKEGFDVALRLGSVAPSSLIVRRLASEPEIVVASPHLMDEREGPWTPKELGGAPWVVHSGLPARSSFTLRSVQGEKKAQVSVTATVAANNVFAVRDLLIAGAGFGTLPLHVVREDLADGRLRYACPGWTLRRLILHALMPARQAPPRVRVFLERLAEAAQSLGFDPV